MSKRRVVVTGLGTVCPVGNDVETMWENIKNGVCGIDEITHFDTTDFKVKLAGEIKNLNVEDYINKKVVAVQFRNRIHRWPFSWWP